MYPEVIRNQYVSPDSHVPHVLVKVPGAVMRHQDQSSSYRIKRLTEGLLTVDAEERKRGRKEKQRTGKTTKCCPLETEWPLLVVYELIVHMIIHIQSSQQEQSRFQQAALTGLSVITQKEGMKWKG